MKRTPVLAAVCVTSLTVAGVARADRSYTVIPYLWASGLDGTQAIAGQEFDVDASFSDIVEFLDIGGAIHFEASGGTWGYFGDAFYAKLSDKKNLPAATLDGETKQTILEGGASYAFSGALEGLAGLRYQDSKLNLDIAGIGSAVSSQDWVDAFVGLRWTPVRTDQWLLSVRGDIGAGDSDLVWLAALNLAYRFNENWSGVLGYRYLDTDYENDGFRWDIVQSGLLLGVGYTW